MERFLCTLPVLFLAEDVAQGAEQTVCSLHLWLNLKEQAHFLLLEVSPVIVVFRQRVSYVRQQVGFGLSIAEFLRLKLFILPLARPAEAFAVLALLDLMGLGVPVPCLGPLLLLLSELPLLSLDLGRVGALELHAHRIKSPGRIKLDDMEMVYNYLCLWEGLLDNAHHAVGEVHRHLLDFISALFLYLVKMLRHVSNGRALDCSYECSLLAVSVPVGEERDQVMVKHRLVYAQSLAHVLLLKHPLTGMLLLVPVRKATQMLLVGTPEVLPVSPEEAPPRIGPSLGSIQPFFLRNPQTLQSSRFPLPQEAGFQGRRCDRLRPTNDGDGHAAELYARVVGSH